MTLGFVSKAFCLIADLAMARGCPMPISEHPGAYEMQIDADWFCAINGRKEPIPWRETAIPSFTAAIEYRQLPIGLISPHGGVLLGGGTPEDDLIAALEKAIEKEKV